jgi:hypothetical protein
MSRLGTIISCGALLLAMSGQTQAEVLYSEDWEHTGLSDGAKVYGYDGWYDGPSISTQRN